MVDVVIVGQGTERYGQGGGGRAITGLAKKKRKAKVKSNVKI